MVPRQVAVTNAGQTRLCTVCRRAPEVKPLHATQARLAFFSFHVRRAGSISHHCGMARATEGRMEPGGMAYSTDGAHAETNWPDSLCLFLVLDVDSCIVLSRETFGHLCRSCLHNNTDEISTRSTILKCRGILTVKVPLIADDSGICCWDFGLFGREYQTRSQSLLLGLWSCQMRIVVDDSGLCCWDFGQVRGISRAFLIAYV